MIRRVRKGIGGIVSAFFLNILVLRARLSSTRVIIFQLHAANQLPHIEPVLRELQKSKMRQRFQVVVMVSPNEILTAKIALRDCRIDAKVFSYHATLFLLFWDAIISVDQRMRLPVIKLGQGMCICMFHGQPTKGNVYVGFNYKRTDGLLFYGPLMRDYYFAQKALHPEWPEIRTWDIGQPKTDSLFAESASGAEAKRRLGLDPGRETVVYAPSFEYCSSLAWLGEGIISALSLIDINVIVKPHPAFYRIVDEKDTYFLGAPHAGEWKMRALKFSNSSNVVFPVDEQIDAKIALEAADLLLTDYSGIAFDAILLDKPVVYFDCPEFFDEYLPSRFGLDGELARNDVTCNAGRSAGVVVKNITEMLSAVKKYLVEPSLDAVERKQLRNYLLFNQGHASEEFMKIITEVSGIHDD